MSEHEREARIQDALNDIFANDSSDDRSFGQPVSAEEKAEKAEHLAQAEEENAQRVAEQRAWAAQEAFEAEEENAQRVAEQRAWAAQEAFEHGGPVWAPVVVSRPLPALSGSPKQIAWAETIRTTFDTVYTNILAPLSLTAEQRVILERLRNRTLNMNTASWWIDHRWELEGREAVNGAIASARQSKHEANRLLAHDATKALRAAKYF